MLHFLGMILAVLFFVVIFAWWCYLVIEIWIGAVRKYGLTCEAQFGWPIYRGPINVWLIVHFLFGRKIGSHRTVELGFLNWYFAITSRG